MSRLRREGAPKLSFFAFQDIITSVSGILILVVLILATDLEKASTSSGRGSPEEIALEERLNALLLERNRVVEELRRLRESQASANSAPSAAKLELDIAGLKQQIETASRQMADARQAIAAANAKIREQDLRLGLTQTREEIDSLRQKNDEMIRRDSAERGKLAEMERRVALAQSQLLRVRSREGQLWFIPEPSTDQREPILVVVGGSGITVERFDKPESRLSYPSPSAAAEWLGYLKRLNKSQQFIVFLIRPSGIDLFRRLRELARDAGFQTGYDAVEEGQKITFGRPPDESGGQPVPTPPETSGGNTGFPAGPRPKASPDGSPPRHPSSVVSGTGFFITEDGYLITNEHVAGMGANVRIRTAAGTLVAKVLRVDKLNDLALLKVEGRFPALAIGESRNVKLGATVATVGFPNPDLQGFSPKLAKGEIGGLAGVRDDARHFQVSAPIQPGNSGGALVDERGNVIGVVVATLNQKAAIATSGSLAQNVNYAVKGRLLLPLLEAVPDAVAKLKGATTRDRKFEDVVGDLERATVLVIVTATPAPDVGSPGGNAPGGGPPTGKPSVNETPSPSNTPAAPASPPKENLSWWRRLLKALGF